MPPRARSHSYNGPVTAKDINAHPNFEPPHHPVQGTISEHARAAHNLRVLKRHYRPIKGILDQIPHCILRLASGGDSNNWELLRGPEGPLFLCECESDSDRPVLAIVVLNTKDLASWVHVLRREDHIEYMWPNLYISPQGRKDVLWPSFHMPASQSQYARFLVRVIARAHLVLRYNVPWPDRWRPQLLEDSPKPPTIMQEKDIMAMSLNEKKWTEVERVTEEVVRVVQAGGSWWLGQCEPPAKGWPASFQVPQEPTPGIWDDNPFLKGQNTGADIPAVDTTTASVATTVSTPARPADEPKSAKKGKATQPSRVLTNDVVTTLMKYPLKASGPQPGASEPGQPDAEANRGRPARISTPSNEQTNGRAKSSRNKAKSVKPREATSNVPTDNERDPSLPPPDRRSTPAPMRVGTPAFGLVDDRLSDDDTDAQTVVPQRRPPAVSQVTKTPEPSSNLTNGIPGRASEPPPAPPIDPKSVFTPYHKKGYIPHNSPNTDGFSATDVEVTKEVIIKAMEQRGPNVAALDKNDWVRELLQLIHTRKDFVDTLYDEYRSRSTASQSS